MEFRQAHLTKMRAVFSEIRENCGSDDESITFAMLEEKINEPTVQQLLETLGRLGHLCFMPSENISTGGLEDWMFGMRGLSSNYLTRTEEVPLSLRPVCPPIGFGCAHVQ